MEGIAKFKAHTRQRSAGLFLLLIAVSALPTATRAQSFVVQGVRVFDGDQLSTNMTVLVRDGLFSSIGTDTAVPPGIEVIDGRGRTLLPGLSPTAALRSATSVPARVFGLSDRGRIAAGLRADLLLVDGDPTANILATRNIVEIWKAGVTFDREAYRVALQAAGVQ